METGADATVQARCIINATGIFSDDLRHLDQPTRPNLLSVSRGTHIVVPAHTLGGTHALMVPKTEDGRIIFAIPWQGVVLIGTTDLPAPASVMEPTYNHDEIDYLISHINPYLAAPISRADILSIFSGLRPLVTGKENKTSKLSREHHIDASQSGMVTVAGGKWTTYRRMAQDTLDFAIRQNLLPPAPCATATLLLHGTGSAPQFTTSYPAKTAEFLAEYGSEASKITNAEPLDPALPYTYGMVLHAIHHEHARTVEDILSRRTRALLLDAAAALRAAPAVAKVMAKELAKDEPWAEAQVDSFTKLASEHYLLAWT
jgi:glycerol-3-phosphate dehydrogenase